MRFLRKLFRSEGEGARDAEAPHGPGEYEHEADGGRGDRQHGDDLRPLHVEGDPRGGSDEDYLRADPRQVVASEGTVMSGPGGAPMEDASPSERREQDRSP